MAKKTANHNVRQLIDKCPMSTTDTKKQLAKFSGLSLRAIQKYYSGDTVTLSIENAHLFLRFFNAHREEYLRKLQLHDIFIEHNVVDTDKIVSDLNLKKH